MPQSHLNKIEIKDKRSNKESNKKQRKNMILKNKFKYLNYKGKSNKFKKINKFY